MTDERRTCKACSQEFAPRRSHHAFCSVRCRSTAKRPNWLSTMPLQQRFFALNPHRPRVCQASGCGETRVLDLAHKVPVRSRQRRLAKDGEVWVLCPTHHRLLDAGIVSSEDLGLPP